MLGYADDEIEPHVRAWERLLHPDDRQRGRPAERERRARAPRPTKASSGCATRTATTSTCCRAAFPCAASRADRSIRIVGTHFDLTEREARRSGAHPHRAAGAPRVRPGRRTTPHRPRDARSVRRAAHGAVASDRCAQGRLPRRPGSRREGRRRSNASPSGSIATSTISSGSSGRRRSTTSACGPRWPTTCRTGRRASTSPRSCTRPASRRAARVGDRNDAVPHRAGSHDQRRQARAARHAWTSSCSGSRTRSCSSSRTMAWGSIRRTPTKGAPRLRPARDAGAREPRRRYDSDRVGARPGHDHPGAHRCRPDGRTSMAEHKGAHPDSAGGRPRDRASRAEAAHRQPARHDGRRRGERRRRRRASRPRRSSPTSS